MKRLFFLFLIVGLVATSCKKPADIPTSQDVVFKATPTATGNFKDGDQDCVNPMAHYALIGIDGQDPIRVDVFYLGGVIYTNTLKLDPGMHTVDSFVLMNDEGTPADMSDDTIVQATPLLGSEYENFVEMPLPFEFEVDAFFKLEINIEILCFVENEYELFGFVWFTVEEVIVREVCFFGDFCTKYFDDYGRSLYAGQSMGLRHDMPAIFMIKVFRTHDVEGVPQRDWIITYDNEDWLGEGYPLCVKYPDFKGVEDTIEFELWILVKVGDGFEYVPFHTFTTVDAEPLADIGDDNVLDFVLGSCVTEADLILPPYMNLPTTATMYVGPTYAPGTLNCYIDIQLSGIGAGFDIDNGWYGANCADKETNIFIGATYDVSVHSSLYPGLLPGGADEFKANFDNINWLKNNLYRYTGADWADCQDAMWMLNNQQTYPGVGVEGNISDLANEMYMDAFAYGDGYMPVVGGWAAVIFLSPAFHEGDPEVQLVFTMVDP